MFLKFHKQVVYPTLIHMARRLHKLPVKERDCHACPTYIFDSKNLQLSDWLMKLAPEKKNIPQIEIPFRMALIKTLLSPDFQTFIHIGWMDEDDDCLRTKRRDFFYRYIKNVNWSKTPFGRLFTTPEEDFHQVEDDAFVYAYDLPRRLSVRVYNDEDIHVH